MATAPLTVWTVHTRAMNRKAGSSAQNAGPKSRSGAGKLDPRNADPRSLPDSRKVVETVQGGDGRAGNDADHRRPQAQPLPCLQHDAGGDNQGRQARRGGAASGDVPSGTLCNCSKMTGVTVTGVSIMTVPVTVGVRIRLNSESRTEKANWKSARTTTRMASRAGPPRGERGDAHRDRRPRCAGREDVAGTETAGPERVKQRSRAAGRDRDEHGPKQNALRLAGRPEHDGRDQHRAGQHEHRDLESQPGGERQRDFLVRMAAVCGVPVGCAGAPLQDC